MLTTAAILGGSMIAGYVGLNTLEQSVPLIKSAPPVPEQESDSDEESVPEVESPTSLPESVPEVESPTSLPEPVAEVESPTSLPEPVAEQQGGSNQDGGYGRPTWAPVRAPESLAKDLGLPAGSPAATLVAKSTGTYKKNPQEIQSELVDVDSQLRVLRVKEFQLKGSIAEQNNILGSTGTGTETLIKRYNTQYNSYLTGKTEYDYYNKQISKIVNESGPEIDTRTFREQYKEFYETKGKNPSDLDDGAKTVEVFNYLKSVSNELPDHLKVKDKNKSGVPIKASDWWGTLKNKPGSSSGNPGDLKGLLKKRSDALTQYTDAEEKMSEFKESYESAKSNLDEYKKQLKDLQSKIKELNDKKELLKTDLSNYEIPRGLFDKKDGQTIKKSVLPTGEDLNILLREYKDIQQKIKETQEEIDNYVSAKLDSDANWKSDTDYETLTGKMTTLKTSLDTIIQKIEGRTSEQKKLLEDNEFESLAKFMMKEKNIKQATELLLKTSFPQVFKMYLELSKASSDTIYDKVDKYYNFFKKGVSSFNGQDVSRAFAFFYGLTKEPRISEDLKNKVTQFSQRNKEIISNALVNLEFALKEIKTPTTEERSIVEQALMSGESIPWKTIKRAAVSVDVSHLFTKSVGEKLVILKDLFRERIYDKLKYVSLKYGLWGKQEVEVNIESPILKQDSVNETSVTLSYTEGVEPSKYVLFMNGNPKAFIDTRTFTLNSLEPETIYSFQLFDNQNPKSLKPSNIINVKTSSFDCVTYVNGELTGDERTGKQEITESRIKEIVKNSNGFMDNKKVRECISNLNILSPPGPTGTSDLEDPNIFIKNYVQKNSITLLGEEEVKEDKTSNYNLDKFPDFGQWIVLKTSGDGNCLTHAFLQSLSSEYRKLPDTKTKNEVGVAFRLEFAKTSIAKNKDLYNQNEGKAWLTDTEIDDFTRLFNVITVIFDDRNSQITTSFGNFKAGDVPENTKVIFIHASDNHYSSVQTPEKRTTMDFKDAVEIKEFVQALSNVSGGGNHVTRRHLLRSRPSLHKTRRTY